MLAPVVVLAGYVGYASQPWAPLQGLREAAFLNYRATAVVAVILAVASIVGAWGQILRASNRGRVLAFAGVALFVASTILPYDISFRDLPGAPRWAPVEYGLPTEEGLASAARGEVLLGGCFVEPFPVRLVWVW